MPDDPSAATPPDASPGGMPGSPDTGVGAGAGGGPAGAPGGAPPGGGPMSVPASAVGAKALAQAQGRVVVTILERMLPTYGSGTVEGKDVLGALKLLSKHFGQEDGDQRSAAMVQLIQRAMGKGGGPPGAGAPGAGAGGQMPSPNRGPIPAPAMA